MAFSKADQFHPQDHHYALLCKAISHPARICILRRILDAQMKDYEPSAGNLIKALPLSQPTLSQHLQYLRSMNIIVASYNGNKTIYSLNMELPDSFIHIIYMIWNSRAEPLGNINDQVQNLYNPVRKSLTTTFPGRI